MSYTIIVFVKQVPDTQNITGDAMKADGTVNRQALPAIFNPEDLNALELALQLKDRYQAKVTVATMGPPSAAEVLRDALCRGADDAVLLTDRDLRPVQVFAGGRWRESAAGPSGRGGRDMARQSARQLTLPEKFRLQICICSLTSIYF